MFTDELLLNSKSVNNIWTDKHIAKNMLLAHLDLQHDGASRNIKTIKKTVDWINSVSEEKRNLLDLGCGPGLYSTEFYLKGYSVTGIDISKLSIEYAKKQAVKNQQNIKYIRRNYLKDRITRKFDIATCIYCDFGALLPKEQITFLENVHQAMNNDGILVFDVFGKGLCNTKKEMKSWSYVEKEDFWSERSHFILNECVHFQKEMVWGNRTIIIEEGKEGKEYITWDHYYDEKAINRIMKNNGFKIEEINSNLISKNSFTSNNVMFVKARKI